MKNYALGLLILTDIVLFLTKDMQAISDGSLSFLLTLVVVVLAAFASSALLRNMKNLKMSRNYTYSGIVGVVLGVIFYIWVNSEIKALTNWFTEHGVTILLIINIICALAIFFARKPRKKTPETATA